MSNAAFDYRLLQDGLHILSRGIDARRILLKDIQDFCNLLEGGLVSYQTLSAETITQLMTMSIGCLICMYPYEYTSTTSTNEQVTKKHTFELVCWRGSSRALNVMCHQTELTLIKHQLQTLGILR
jgi:hypothetical protein